MNRDDLIKQVIKYTCSKNCQGEQNHHGGCCTVGDGEFILGEIDDHERFLQDLSERFGREIKFHEVFFTYETGKRFFPDRPTWQNKEHYPALKVVNDPDNDYPCIFYDVANKRCTVYEIRPQTCRTYYCDYLRRLTNMF